MANEIIATSIGTGVTAYTVLRNAAWQVWNGTAFEAYNVANWANYAILSASTDSLGDYIASFPSAITTPGLYYYHVYERAGGSPASTDNRLTLSAGLTNWNGTAEQILSIDASGRVDVGKIAGQTANASAAVTFPASVGNSTFAGGAVASVAGSVGSVTTPVTVGTNTDKTGYGLSLSERNSVALEVWSLSTAPTPSQIAAAILVTTANKITTDATGRVNLNMTQAVPTTNTAETVGDALNAGRAQAFGKWTLVGTALTMYAADGTTVVRTFTLDTATNPTQRV